MRHLGRTGSRVVHLRSGRVLVNRLRVPRTPLGRALGLMFRSRLETGEGMLITPCNGIHTCFLRGAIDVVFLDREDRVVRVRERLAPWRVLPFVSRARSVLELPAGSIEKLGLQVGERLLIVPSEDEVGSAAVGEERSPGSTA